MASKEEVSEETGDKITLIPGTSRKRKSRLWLHKPKSNKYPKLEDRHSVSSSSATPKNLPSTAKPNSDKLIRAPFKARSKRKKLQGKRKLFTDSLNDQLMEITELLPIFLKKLHVAGMSTVTELMHYRCDPSERVFHMSTTIRSVYPKNPLSETIDAQPIDEDPCEMDSGVRPSTSIQHPSGAVHIRDHAFDRQQHRRKKRQSKRADISKLHAVARGCLPVRQHHKCDESKILPTTRLGIDLQ